MANHLGEINQLIFDRPAKLEIYNYIIKVLEDMTGIRWGWVATKFSAKCISSNEFPISVGVMFMRRPARYKKIKNALDLVIENNTLRQYIDKNMWAEATVCEIREKLLALTEKITDPLLRARIALRIQRRGLKGDYAVLVAESIAAPPTPAAPDVFDVWLADCLRT